MSCGNQKVVRVTCQCIGISLRISDSTDCQLLFAADDVRTLAMLRRIPVHLQQPAHSPTVSFFSFYAVPLSFYPKIISTLCT